MNGDLPLLSSWQSQLENKDILDSDFYFMILTSKYEHEAGHPVQQLHVGEEFPLRRQVVRVQDGRLKNKF